MYTQTYHILPWLAVYFTLLKKVSIKIDILNCIFIVTRSTETHKRHTDMLEEPARVSALLRRAFVQKNKSQLPLCTLSS